MDINWRGSTLQSSNLILCVVILIDPAFCEDALSCVGCPLVVNPVMIPPLISPPPSIELDQQELQLISAGGAT